MGLSAPDVALLCASRMEGGLLMGKRPLPPYSPSSASERSPVFKAALPLAFL